MAQFIERARLESLNTQAHQQLDRSINGYQEGFAFFNAMLSELLTLDHISESSVETKNDSDSEYKRQTTPEYSLKAEEIHFKQQETINQRVNHNDFISFALFRSLYSAPLSQFNDAKHVPTEVIANMSYFAQMNFEKAKKSAHYEDESPTLLYDILQQQNGQDSHNADKSESLHSVV